MICDTPDGICAGLAEYSSVSSQRVLIAFSVRTPANFSESKAIGLFVAQGYTYVRHLEPGMVEIVQNRIESTLETGRDSWKVLRPHSRPAAGTSPSIS